MSQDENEEKNELATTETPRERLDRARREAKAAKLRLQAARIEAGEDVDDDEDDDDDFAPPARRGGGGAFDLASIAGGAAGLMKQFQDMGVEEETPTNAEGGRGFKFRRPAGSIRDVELDGNGKVRRVRYKPDDWPPRGESF